MTSRGRKDGGKKELVRRKVARSKIISLLWVWEALGKYSLFQHNIWAVSNCLHPGRSIVVWWVLCILWNQTMILYTRGFMSVACVCLLKYCISSKQKKQYINQFPKSQVRKPTSDQVQEASTPTHPLSWGTKGLWSPTLWWEKWKWDSLKVTGPGTDHTWRSCLSDRNLLPPSCPHNLLS